jgi:hypothetical protein
MRFKTNKTFVKGPTKKLKIKRINIKLEKYNISQIEIEEINETFTKESIKKIINKKNKY